MHRLRRLPLAAALAACIWPALAAAEDAATAKPKDDATAAEVVPAQPLALPAAPVALAVGREPRTLLASLADGHVVWLSLADRTVTRKLRIGAPDEEALTLVDLQAGTAPGSLLGATAAHLVSIDETSGAVRWKTARPIAFSALESGVLTLSSDGTLRTLDAETGAVRSERKIKERRRVVKASIAPSGETVVLGVDDG